MRAFLVPIDRKTPSNTSASATTATVPAPTIPRPTSPSTSAYEQAGALNEDAYIRSLQASEPSQLIQSCQQSTKSMYSFCSYPNVDEALHDFFEVAKSLEETYLSSTTVNVEVEARLGSVNSQGKFMSGLCQGRFRMLYEWLDQSNVNTEPWVESLTVHKGSYRSESRKGIYARNIIDKQIQKSIVVKSNHPEGVAVKFVISLEKMVSRDEVETKAFPSEKKVIFKATPFQIVRLRHRKQYFFGGKQNDNFSLDFTLVWSGATEKAAREELRNGKGKKCEVELELQNNALLKEKSASQLTLSFFETLLSLFKDEMNIPMAFNTVREIVS